MQKITPCLWFDAEAEEAARYYVDTFDDAGLGRVTRYDAASAEASGQPEGSTMTVEFELEGYGFVGLNGGPHFSFTPAISFFVSCETTDEIDRLHGRLSDGGSVLMPLQEYPFSQRFGWVDDRYGVSWQLNLAPAEQKITPALMFVGEQHGKAEEALRLYASLFEDSSVERIERHGPDDGDPRVGTVKYAELRLAGQWLRATDGGPDHDFTFTEAVSLQVACRNQHEVDHFWNGFTENGEESQCGWLKDGYGVSWQIVPTVLTDLLRDEKAERSRRVTRALLEMRKIDIGRLEAAAAAHVP